MSGEREMKKYEKEIVFHEMVHLIIKNHKKSFWLHIKKEYKHPEKYEERLYGYWFLIIGQRG